VKMSIKSIGIAALGVVTAVLGLASPAAAHVTASPESSAAGDYARLEFGVGHGCEGLPTTRVRIQIPDTVPSATPERNPLWDLSTREGRKQRTDMHGETITRGVSEVIWTARQPLPEGELEVLGMSVLMPDTAGETVYFPAIQECAKGQHRWIQIPAAGESGEELEEPAPQVELTAAASEHGSGEGSEPEDSDAASPGLGIAALIVGALGLLAGGAALVRSRRAA